MPFTYAGHYGPEAIIDLRGEARLGATVTVYLSDGSTLATLYSDRTKASTASNPVYVDARGNLEFWADPGEYEVEVAHQGEVVARSDITVPLDPVELAGHLDDPTMAHLATAIGVNPTGALTATNVQGALEQLTQSDVSQHVAEETDAHDASAISVLPAGSISSVNVQAALEELDADVQAGAGLAAHISDSSDAHDASAISFSATGAIASTDVQAALAELDSEKATTAALSSHEADTTNVHGIANTANLETTSGAQTKVDAHVNDASDAHAASAITNTPAGNIGGTTVQAALNELDTEKATTGSVTSVASDLAAHLADSADAHDASAISVVPFSTVSATTVQAALEEIVSESGGGGAPSGPAGGVLSGTYPDPGFAVDMATQAELNTHEADTTSVHGITDTAQIPLKNAANTFTEAQTINGGTSNKDRLNLGADTTIYRGSANEIRTDDDLTLSGGRRLKFGSGADGTIDFDGQATVSDIVTSRHDGDTNERFSIGSAGLLSWGPGNAARDTFLQRSAANTLRINDALNVIGALTQNGSAVSLASDLTTHAADTTSIHGIADTSVLETTTGAQTKVDTHVNDTSAAHAASAVSFSATGGLSSTDVQAAIAELDTEKATAAALTAHIDDTSAAHAASAISYAGGTGMSATDVEAAIDELATEKSDTTHTHDTRYERMFTLGKAGAIPAAAEDIGDFNVPVGFNSTAVRVKATVLTAVSTDTVFQVRRSTDAGANFSDVSGFTVTIAAGAKRGVADPSNVDLDENDLLQVSKDSGTGGTNLLVGVVATAR